MTPRTRIQLRRTTGAGPRQAPRRPGGRGGPPEGGKNADIRPVACDLSSLVALRVFVAEFSRQEQRLDVLVNNAGVMPDGRTHTVDGLESMFATRVLAPWALIDGLLRC